MYLVHVARLAWIQKKRLQLRLLDRLGVRGAKLNATPIWARCRFVLYFRLLELRIWMRLRKMLKKVMTKETGVMAKHETLASEV